MSHPTYPLQKEQRAAVLRATEEGGDSGAIRAIKAHYDKKRDAEFPGWWPIYQEQVERWVESQTLRFSQYTENAVGC